MQVNDKFGEEKTEYGLGIDVGGTNTRIGLFTREGELLASHSILTSHLTERTSINVISSEFGQIFAVSQCATTDISAIGLALPGMVDAEGELKLAPNLDIDISRYEKMLKAVFPNAKICVLNDSNAAVLGDKWAGTAAELPVKNYMLIMLGTGIGGGVVIEGELFMGAHGATGELGHVCVEPHEGRPCKCGKSGCLERYASSKGIAVTAQEIFEHELSRCDLERKTGIDEATWTRGRSSALEAYPHSKEVFEAAAAGDRIANLAMHSFTDYLARGLSYVSSIIDPEVFILGGGVTGSADVFMDELHKRYRNYALSVCKDTPIMVSKLAYDCGIYGAAYYAFNSE